MQITKTKTNNNTTLSGLNDRPYSFCLCYDPNKGFNTFSFKTNAVQWMQRNKNAEKTERGARLCQGEPMKRALQNTSRLTHT